MWGIAVATLVRARLRDPKRWRELTQRGGWTWKFSRVDVLVYSLLALSVLHVVGMTIFRTTEVSEHTAQNTKRMGEVVEQMRESSDQSAALLAAMREEAEAARRETAAAQRLALWVGVGTALVGAVLGGVAGAFSAQALG